MSMHANLLCVFVVLSWSAVSAHVLVPPQGYSVGFTGTIANGVQKYVCKHGSWSKTGSSADVYANRSKLGTYWSVYNCTTKSMSYNWDIINGGGSSFESGDDISGLRASPVKSVQVSSTDIAEYLACVKEHRGAGDAAQVAFVSLTGTKGGLAPRQALCSEQGSTSGVPFNGDFIFYTADREAPQVPASIAPAGDFVQSLFLEGKMYYEFKDGEWCYKGLFANIADVAGGTLLGKMGTVKSRDSFGSDIYWRFDDPNGFWLKGQQCAKPVKMYDEGCPWQLLKITTSGGSVSPLGPYKNAVIAATYGGEPPKLVARTNGMIWGSCFTALCSLYA